LGSCRKKLKTQDLERVLDVFKAHNIRYFFYNGGNDSMDTAHKISQMATEKGYEMCVLGIPKTVDNDLAETDHCPGFGSIARWMAIATRDLGLDTQAGALTSTSITIMEAMGRDAGWITGSMILAKHEEDDAPHLIYLPEVPFETDKFLHAVQRVHDRLGYVIIALSEGIRDHTGNLISKSSSSVDAFGNVQLGGVGEYLAQMITRELKLKARATLPGMIPRASILGASRVDLDEAYLVGQMAVKYALEGQSGYMVSLMRTSDEPYACTTGLSPLAKVANANRTIPLDWITPDKNYVNEHFVRYVKPLVGEMLPDYMRFQKHPVNKLLPAYRP
jgi:6-phosphofructokinase 1